MPDSIMTIMAHPDDAEIWAGGTLALYARASAQVCIVVASEDEVRRTEASKGAASLACSLKLLSKLTVANCCEIIGAKRPDIIITHRLDDSHQDHRAAATVAIEASCLAQIRCGLPRKLYACDTYESYSLNGAVGASSIIDISSTFEQKLAAIALYESQPVDHFLAMARRLGAIWGGRIGAQWAEAFSPIPILGRLPAASAL